MALSSEQQQIVDHPVDRHAVVLAVAGSGKSHTMVERVAFLIEANRVPHSAIIAVMFNKSASEEFEERLGKRLGKANAPESVTYHRLGTLTLKILVKAGLAPDWTFDANPNSARNFTADVIADACRINGHKYPRIVADAFLSFVDRVKSDLTTPLKVWEAGNWQNSYSWFVDYFPIYEKARADAKMRFFSDLIYDPLVILQQSEQARRVVANRYRHIIIDEFQDICCSQYELVRYVAGSLARVMVVGDDDQTIYSWRGAKPSYILRDFEKDYEGAICYRMTRTWRYGHALSCAASHLIVNNTDRADKLCISSDSTPNTKISYTEDKGDGEAVVSVIKKQVAAGRRLADIAVLIRTYSHSGSAQLGMLASSIPFRLEGGNNASILDNPWVKMFIGWLKIAAGDIANRPYAGEPDMKSVFELRSVICMPSPVNFELSKALCSCVLSEPQNGEGFTTFIKQNLQGPRGPIQEALTKLQGVWTAVRNLRPRVDEIDPKQLMLQLHEKLELKRLLGNYHSKQEDADDELDLINTFIDYAGQMGGGSVSSFLDHIVDLQSFSDRSKETTEAVHVTSLHRSKGLEWPCVIMIGLSQGRLPLANRLMKPGDSGWEEHLEDERRLAYVGITRAREQLCLIGPADPMLSKWWSAGRTGCPEQLDYEGRSASQFLYETNLYLSSMMPLIIYKGSKPVATNPGLANLYLEDIGHTTRVTPINEGDS